MVVSGQFYGRIAQGEELSQAMIKSLVSIIECGATRHLRIESFIRDVTKYARVPILLNSPKKNFL